MELTFHTPQYVPLLLLPKKQHPNSAPLHISQANTTFSINTPRNDIDTLNFYIKALTRLWVAFGIGSEIK
jgi:hypothetical protein